MENTRKINKLICEFDEKIIENGFLEWENDKKGQAFMQIVLALALAFIIFMGIDILFLELNLNTGFILFFRGLMAVSCIILFAAIKNKEKSQRILLLTSICEFTTILSFLAIYSLYTDPDILPQSLSMIALMITIVIIPNRFSRIVLLYFFGYIVFITITFINFTNNAATLSDLWPSLILFGVVILTLIVFSHMMNLYNRIIYINHLEMRELASTDTLTKIYNRTRFEEEIMNWFQISRRYKNKLCLLEFDIDNFKLINDTHGHFVGDKVLIEVAKRVKEEIRETDVFARWGGDEFMVLLPNITIEDAYDVSSRTRKIINSIRIEGVEKVDCSMGLVSRKDEEEIEDIMIRADKMLYESKRAGKGIITCETYSENLELNQPTQLREEYDGV